MLLLSTSIYSYANSEITDPYEKSNRIIHNFNDKVDVLILRPVSVGYSILPNPLEEGIKIAAEQAQDFFNIANGIHLMAVKTEHLIPEILEKAQLSLEY